MRLLRFVSVAAVLIGSVTADGQSLNQDAGASAAPAFAVVSIRQNTAVQEQLGLKFESTTAPVDVLVIDGVSMPAEN